MKLSSLLVMIYGVILVIGGFIGHSKGSQISLFMGGIIGVIIFLDGIAIQRKVLVAHYWATILSALLTLFFSYRLYQTFKFMPSGLMIILSAALCLFLLFSKPKPFSLKK